jgi:hypothetical protein
VGNDGERQGPFIVAGEGHARVRKGEMTGGNGLNAIDSGRFNEGLKGGIDGGGNVTAHGRHLEVLSGGRRWRDAVVARPSSGRAGGT